jgi:hypothetical protein
MLKEARERGNGIPYCNCNNGEGLLLGIKWIHEKGAEIRYYKNETVKVCF